MLIAIKVELIGSIAEARSGPSQKQAHTGQNSETPPEDDILQAPAQVQHMNGGANLVVSIID